MTRRQGTLVKSDCYAILGVSSSAEDVVIRAAYLALMRRYHPDRDPSPEAADKARKITQAFKEIGDPARRAEYDARRAAEAYEILGFAPEAEPPPRRWRAAPVLVGITASAFALLAAVLVAPLVPREPPGSPAPVPTRQAAEPVERQRPAESRETEPEPPAALPPVADPQLAEVDMPPPPEVIEAKAEPKPKAEAPPARPRPARPATRDAPSSTVAAAAARAPATDDQRLAAVERQATLFFNQSVAHADAAKRQQLQQARGRFMVVRSGCQSASCITDAHLGHMRDVARIMESPSPSSL